MASHGLKRVMRGAATSTTLAITTLVVAVGLTSAPAMAEPSRQAPPTSASDAMDQYQKLSGQAEKLNEKYLQAKQDLKAKKDELAKANDSLDAAKKSEGQAKQQEEQFRGKVDDLSDASYKGARFTQLSALLTGKSPQDFLDRASALHVLASENYGALHKLAAATKKADDAKHQAAGAKKKAKDAKDAANQLVTDIGHKKKALDANIDKVKDALSELSSSQQAELNDPGDSGVFVGGSGAAGAALQAALGQRGTPYSWGGASPGGFDCSGLMMWSYAQAGVDLPRTSQAQQGVGKPVSRSNLKPGDLVFYGSPAYHVGMYVGNGKMVDAPTAGEVVRVESLQSNYSGARRVAG